MAKKECPRCGSNKISMIQHGIIAWSPEMENDDKDGKVALGGCHVNGNDLNSHRNSCGLEWIYEEHPFHKEVAKRLMEIQQASRDHTLFLDRSCETNPVMSQCIPFFSDIDQNEITTKDETRHYCDVDAIFIRKGERPSIDVVIEIEESGITPIKVCGKFMTSALSRGCIHYSFGNDIVPIARGSLFVQVLLRSEQMLKSGSELELKMRSIEMSIKALVETGDFAFSDYAMIIGDLEEFANSSGEPSMRLKKTILDKISPS